MNRIFYNIIRYILVGFMYLFFHPKVVGKENIKRDGSLVLAGNHTSYFDPLLLIAVVPRKIHFLAKIELFTKGIVGLVIRKMGCIPVNRKLHTGKPLKNATDVLNNKEVIGIFPEATINKSSDLTLPFKIGAIKMSHDTDSYLVPFIITGKFRVFGKSVKIEFLKGRKIGSNLDEENIKLRDEIASKILDSRGNIHE